MCLKPMVIHCLIHSMHSAENTLSCATEPALLTMNFIHSHGLHHQQFQEFCQKKKLNVLTCLTIP